MYIARQTSSSTFSSIFYFLQFLLIFSSTRSRSQFVNHEDEFRPISMKLSDESCRFPSRWIGDWFQSGVNQAITINHTRISGKGRCVEADGDKFILYSQSEACYRCVVFHEKHLNVLQYKETLCYDDPSGLSLQSLCRRIPGDAHLFAMFRLDGVPVQCPFQGSFTFAYSRGPEVCQSPVSTIDTCIRNSQLVLDYQACYDVIGTESRVDEMECLATWKEGSTRYLLGLLQYHHDPSFYEERFRCFAYEKGYQGGGLLDTPDKVVFRVAQSGDATCLGLTPAEGSKTLTLRRVIPVTRPCQFPNWLQAHAQWLSLNGKFSYAFENDTLRIRNSSNQWESRRDVNVNDDILVSSAICTKQLVDGGEDKATFILRVTTGCQIGYACLKVYRRDAHIIELQMSNLLSRDLETVCHSSNFNENMVPIVTLTTPTPEIRECPYTGHFDITDITIVSARHCRQEFKGSVIMGCSSIDSVRMNMYCPNTQKVHEEYTCNGWWEESDETFLIVSSAEDNDRFCFRIQEKFLEFSPQELKQRGMKVIEYDGSGESEINDSRSSHQHKVFNFIKYATNCHRKWSVVLPPSVSQLAISFNTTNLGLCNQENSGRRNFISVAYPIEIISFLFLFLIFPFLLS